MRTLLKERDRREILARLTRLRADRGSSVEQFPELLGPLSSLKDLPHADKIVNGGIISGTARAVSLPWMDPHCS